MGLTVHSSQMLQLIKLPGKLVELQIPESLYPEIIAEEVQIGVQNLDF